MGQGLQSAAWSASFFFVMLSICVRIVGAGDASNYGRNLFIEMFIVIGAAFWAMHVLLSGKMAWIRSPMNILIAAFFALSAVAAFRAPHLQRSIPALIDWVGYLLLFFLVIQLGITGKSAGLFIYALIACAAAISVYGIFQYHHSLEVIARQLETDPMATLRKMGHPITVLPDLLARVKDKRIFASFANPNSLAGLLLMTIPLSVGVLIDACRDFRNRIWESLAAFLATALQLHALVLTFSKGGCVTLVIMAALFAVVAGWRLIKNHKKASVVIAAAAVIAAAGLSAVAVRHVRSADADNPPPIAAKLRGAAESMQVRIGYWQAGLKMIADHPLLGVGLDNFGDRYLEYKLPTGREVRRAHNNYLQIAADLGVPALIIFCVLWGGLIRASFPKERIPHERPEGYPLFYTSAAAGALAFVVTGLLLASLDFFPSAASTAAGYVLLLGIWMLVFVPGAAGGTAGVKIEKDAGPRDLFFIRTGIFVGLVGFMIHGIADFDLSVPGCGQTVWILAALGLVLRERRPQDRIISVGPAKQAAIAVGAVALCAVFIVPRVGLVMRALEAESSIARAKEKRGEEPLTAANLLEAIRLCEQAARANPLDDEPRYLLARSCETIWMMHGRNDAAAFHEAILNFRKTLELSPTHNAALYRIAMMYRDAGIYEKHLLLQRIPLHESGLNTIQLARRQAAQSPALSRADLSSSSINPRFIPYVWAAAGAVESYPTNSHYRVALGEALHLAGLEAAASEQYAKALEYHRLAPIDRLKLSDHERETAEKWVGTGG